MSCVHASWSIIVEENIYFQFNKWCMKILQCCFIFDVHGGIALGISIVVPFQLIGLDWVWNRSWRRIRDKLAFLSNALPFVKLHCSRKVRMTKYLSLVTWTCRMISGWVIMLIAAERRHDIMPRQLSSCLLILPRASLPGRKKRGTPVREMQENWFSDNYQYVVSPSPVLCQYLTEVVHVPLIRWNRVWIKSASETDKSLLRIPIGQIQRLTDEDVFSTCTDDRAYDDEHLSRAVFSLREKRAGVLQRFLACVRTDPIFLGEMIRCVRMCGSGSPPADFRWSSQITSWHSLKHSRGLVTSTFADKTQPNIIEIH